MNDFESLFEIYQAAVFQKDVEAFVSIFDEHILAFDMWQRWDYDGLANWRHFAENWFDSLGTNRDLVSFEDIQIHQEPELATATAVMKFTAVSEKGEELRFLQNRLTWIARKKNGEWKIVHQHTSSPVDFESMKVILKK